MVLAQVPVVRVLWRDLMLLGLDLLDALHLSLPLPHKSPPKNLLS
jgi:hypothetical protein